MLAARPLAETWQLPPEHFNTLGNLIAFPLELLLVLCIPATRSLVRQSLARTPDARGRVESFLAVALKVVLAFGVWGAMYAGLGKAIAFDEIDRWYFSLWGAVMAVLAVSVGPLCEEIIFRGALLRLWERQWGWTVAMFLSAAAFAAIHPKNIVSTFLSGVVYACLMRRTGSLWAPFICHATYNLLVTWPILGRVFQEQTFANPDGVASAPWVATTFVLGSTGLVFYIYLAARHPASQT